MKRIALLFVIFCICFTVYAQGPQSTALRNAPQQAFPLWTDAAPGAKGTNPDKDVPTLTPFWPVNADQATTPTAAMIVCPGGGYAMLASGHEGRDYALWLSERGIACFMLKYRLGSNGYRHPIMLQDVQRAIRLVRSRAADWNIDPRRVGVMGSSAGGHLASTALTHFDAGKPDAEDVVERQSSRPDLGILCYAVITMGKFTHPGSHDLLIGKDASPELVTLLSNEQQVTKDTPPCFIWHTVADKLVPVENSLDFAAALQKSKVPYELHLYQKGDHGLGMGARTYTIGKTKQEELLPWTMEMGRWLQEQGFILKKS